MIMAMVNITFAITHQLATKQRNEHNSLRKKIITGLEELEIKREKEYEMLLHNFNNLKRSIENHQSMETQLFEKSVRTNRIFFYELNF